MCDYSLHAAATRPAEVAETLETTRFPFTTTRGFAGLDDPHVAVCLRPGTEIAFENDVLAEGVLFHRNVRDRLARFREINLGLSHHHHDALEFANGEIVLVTELKPGQRAIVLQLPVSPAAEKPRAAEPAAPRKVARITP
jgi:hypothetical protein